MPADRTDAVTAGPEAAQLEQWFAEAPVGLALVDAELRVLRENAALGRLTRGDAAQLLRDPAVAQALARARAGERPDAVLVRPPGDPLHRIAVSLLGLAGGVAITAVPITDDRVAQEALQLALEGTETGTWVWDVAGDAIHWSPNLGPLHGRDRGATPRTYAEWLSDVHPDDRDMLAGLVADALAGAPGYVCEFRLATATADADGRPRWLHTRAHVIRDAEDGPARAILGLTSDVTERKRHGEAAEVLADAGLALAGSMEPDEALREVAELAVPRLADWCAVHVVDEHGRPSRLAIAHGDPERAAWAASIPERPDPVPRGPGAVLRSGRAELLPTIDDALLRESAGDDAELLELLRGLGMRSAMVVPVRAHDRTLGTITFVHAESGRSYDEIDLALGEELGRRAGLAVENATLHRAREDANRRLRDLQAVTDVALTHLELDALLEELLTRLGEVLEADLAKVLLFDEDRATLRVRASIGLDEEAARSLSVPSGSGVAGRIAAAGRPLILSDMAGEDVVLRDLREPGRALAGMPLRLDDETIGVLVVSSRARRYVEADLQLLELVADRAARAIRQAALYEAARAAALSLQRSLLPAALPEVPGIDLAARYLPGQDGAEVGGDWYDLFELPDGRLALTVGDVVGRGLGAAARMGRVRTALRAYAFESSSPADAVDRLDRLLAAEEPLEFTTLLVVFLDPATGAARACSAGHLPPMVVDAAGATTAAVAGGPPIGVAPGARRESALMLPEGATLIAYTDGLVEDRRIGLDVGLERLAAAAGGGGTARALVDRIVERLVGDGAAGDDVALVAVRRIGRSVRRTFPAEPPAVAAARHEVTSFAAAHGLGETLLADVALAVSEACTNVVVHAYRAAQTGPMHVAARFCDGGLEVTIADEGVGVRPRSDSPGVGLGLQIIARTTAAFHVRDAPGGGAQLVLRFAAGT